MKNKKIRGRPPRHYFVRCDTCGTYPIEEESARRFLTEDLKKKLDQALHEGAHGTVLHFLNGCPRCTPANPDAVIELSVLKPRKH